MPSSKSTPKVRALRAAPHALDAWVAMRALREADLIWDATHLGSYPPPIRQGVTVINVRGQRVGVHVEVGPPDPRREQAAASQGWIYIALVPGVDVLNVVDVLRTQRRALATALGERPSWSG